MANYYLPVVISRGELFKKGRKSQMKAGCRLVRADRRAPDRPVRDALLGWPSVRQSVSPHILMY